MSHRSAETATYAGEMARIELDLPDDLLDFVYVAVARRHDWTLVSTDISDLVSQGLAITSDAAV